MKIVIHYSGGEEFKIKLDRLLYSLKYHTVEYVFDFKKETGYFYNKKHYDFYRDIFNKCNEVKADLLFLTIDELVDVDILLNELRRKGPQKTKIIFTFSCREIERSEARKKSFIQLLDHPNTVVGILQSMIDNSSIIEHRKVVSGSSLIHFPKLPDFNVLYFGRIKYAKGPDILADAKKYMSEYVKITIAGPLEDDLDLENKVDEYMPWLISEIDVPNLFRKADLVVLPYRKLYKNGHSTVLIQACEYRKPVVVPDFFPFNKVVYEYKIGKVFKSEDSLDLARTINSFLSDGYSQYIKFLQDIDDQNIIRRILESE